MAHKNKQGEYVLSEAEAKALYEAAKTLQCTVEELQLRLMAAQTPQTELPPDPAGSIAAWAGTWNK